MINYSSFDIESAKNLINRGYDGSIINRMSLNTAKNLLNRAAMDLRIFASLRDSKAAKNCLNMAYEYESIANKVQF